MMPSLFEMLDHLYKRAAGLEKGEHYGSVITYRPLKKDQNLREKPGVLENFGK
jgi:hypothetical protein